MTAAAAAFVYGGSGSIGVTLSPTYVTGYYSGGGASDVTTGAVLAAGTGGVAPYTYAWTQVGATPYTWTADAPTAASTTFTADSLPEGVSDVAAFRVTVTDAAGGTGSADISAAAINNTPYYGGFGGIDIR